MRTVPFLVLGLTLGVAAIVLAAAPPARSLPDTRRLLSRLEDEDFAVRRSAMQALEERGEDLLGPLEEIARSNRDVDVRLRALVVRRGILSQGRGLVRAFAPGAGLKVAPPFGGYWLNRVKFSQDAKYAVVGGGALILYEVETGKEVRRALEVGGARPGVAISHDGKHVLTSHNNDTRFHLLGIPVLDTIQTFTGHTSGVHDVALSRNDRLAISAGLDGTIRVWDVKTGKQLHSLFGFAGGPLRVAISPDGKRILSGHTGGPGMVDNVRLWDMDTGKLLRSFEGLRGNVTGLGFLTDGKSAVVTDDTGSIRTWAVETGKELRAWTHGGTVNDLAISPDGKRALTAGTRDRLVKLWDLTTGKAIDAFEGHLSSVLGVGFSSDGRLALSSDTVCTVRLWKLGR